MARLHIKKTKPTPPPSTTIVDYPHEKHIDFTKKSHKKQFRESKHKTFLVSPTISIEALDKVHIKDEVISLLEGAKLGILTRPHKVYQFETPTREFVASFEEYNDDGGKGWSFQLGGKAFRKSKEEICELFGFSSDDDGDKEFDAHEKDEFWKEIAEMDYFVALMSPKNIKSGVWKYIHRLLSTTFFTRLDGARFVQNKDFNTMLVIKKGQPVNAYAHLTEWFTTWGYPKTENKAIGGGLFVSLLAENLGINLATSGKRHFKPLDVHSMVLSKMWCKKTSSWVHELDITERTHKTLTYRLEREEAARQKATQSRTRDPNGAKMKAPSLADPSKLEEDIRAHMEESSNFMVETRAFMAKMLAAEEERRARDEMILAALRNRDTAPTASTSHVIPAPTPTEMELFEALLSGDPPL